MQALAGVQRQTASRPCGTSAAPAVPRHGSRQMRACSSAASPQQQSEITTAPSTSREEQQHTPIKWHGLHHVAVLCADLKKSMDFYQSMLGLEVNPDRPDDKLPYPGAWLWIGPDMVHLMELPNPDPLEGRATHGGRDRHFCSGVANIDPLIARLEAAGITYTMSKSGRRAVFFRDPDMNTLEVVELEPWR